jgi:Xaa-Pro aminopeptidase
MATLAAAPAETQSLTPPPIDFDRLRRYRLGRLQQGLARAGVDLAVLTSPISLRYAVDFDEYQLFQSHIPTFTLMVPAEGAPAICGAYRWQSDLGVERLPPAKLCPFDSGLTMVEESRAFADLLRGRLPPRARVAVERLDAGTVQALMQAGFEVVDAGGILQAARAIKSEEEIALIRYALAVAGLAIDRMRADLRPGVTEAALLARLQQVNMAHGGGWLDGRMLASGPRTNPWLQEATLRPIEAGEIVAFDTDMVGPFGYFADVSRTLLCGDAPTPQQRDLYCRAYEEVHHNIALMRPGTAFRDISDRAFRQPDRFIAHRYVCLAHGVGLSDEWPKIAYRQDWPDLGYDGVLEAGMVLCVESFVGDEAGGEGVKLEQQILVTEAGPEILSDYPFEGALLA